MFEEVPVPAFADVQPGSFVEPVLVPDSVSLVLPAGAAGMRYSLTPTGSEPENWQEYTGPIELIAGTTTITAYAYTTETTTSDFLSGTFIRNTAPVRTTPTAGAYTGASGFIELQSATEAAEIWYTLDGSEPVADGSSSFLYGNPLDLPAGEILELRAIAAATGREPSASNAAVFYGSTSLYVDAAAGTDDNTGLSSLVPKRTIGSALEMAATMGGNTLITIRIAGGTYEESALAVESLVRISGSWDSDFSDQDFAVTPTVISSTAALVGTRDNPVATLTFRRDSGDSALDTCIVNSPVVGTAEPDFSTALKIVSAGNVTVETAELRGIAGSGRILNAGLYVSNSSPFVSDCLLQGGETSLADPDTVSGSFGAVFIGTASSEAVVEDCRIYAGESNTGSCGIFIRDTASMKLRRNQIYGSDTGTGLKVGIYLDAATVPLDGLTVIANMIMPSGTVSTSDYYGVFHRAGVLSRPIIINNTVYAAGGSNNAALHNTVTAAGADRAARPVLINNILQTATGGYAIQEAHVDTFITDPQALHNNNLFGDGAHYDNVSATITPLACLGSSLDQAGMAAAG